MGQNMVGDMTINGKSTAGPDSGIELTSVGTEPGE